MAVLLMVLRNHTVRMTATVYVVRVSWTTPMRTLFNMQQAISVSGLSLVVIALRTVHMCALHISTVTLTFSTGNRAGMGLPYGLRHVYSP